MKRKQRRGARGGGACNCSDSFSSSPQLQTIEFLGQCRVYQQSLDSRCLCRREAAVTILLVLGSRTPSCIDRTTSVSRKARRPRFGAEAHVRESVGWRACGASR